MKNQRVKGTILMELLVVGVLSAIAIADVLADESPAGTESLGNGFYHHGVATPISNHRGTVATVDGEGRNVALVWLFDHRGGYALLVVDAETGKSQEFPMPFPPGGDCPYASILSSKNRFYTHFNSHFVEFDPQKRAFTFFQATTPRMAMAMTEDDNGVIWSVTYPNSGVVSFDPATGALKDYGVVHKENWNQYPRHIAADDKGWVYFGIGSAASQIIILDPDTGASQAILQEQERVKGYASVFRDMNGKVYGNSGSGAQEDGYELYSGESKRISMPEEVNRKPIITSNQGLFHKAFPDGTILQRCDLVERLVVVENPETGEVKRSTFEYTSEGAHLMGLAAAPDGTICGGTAFPMRFFSYNPKTDTWINRASYGQWNTVAARGDRFFVGGYGGGYLLEWDPSQPWVPTVKGEEGCNPKFLTDCSPTINRPHDLLAHPDGKTLVLAGTPGYGYTGGGLLFWDRETGTRTVLEHTDILADQSTATLVALPEGKLLGASTTSPGTGGEVKAKEAELYIMDMVTKKVEWHSAIFPGAQYYTDMYYAASGLVYGVADRKLFFVFDPAKRVVVHQVDLVAEYGLTIYHQGPRVFVPGADGVLYMLFAKGIAQVNLNTHEITMLAESPVPVQAGGDVLDGRLYFASGSHLYSYELPGEK